MARQVFLKQGTKSWHDFRFQHIGSSDAAIIIGDIHPRETDTPQELMRRKIAKTHKEFSWFQLQHIRRGQSRESELRGLYHRRYDLEDVYIPAVFESEEYPFMGASLDGWLDETGIILEIKSTTNMRQHQLIHNAEMPIYYYPQVQHQLLVTGAHEVRFLSFYNKTIIGDSDNNFPFYKVNLAEVRVSRDNEYIKRLIEVEKAWWDECIRRKRKKNLLEARRY